MEGKFVLHRNHTKNLVIIGFSKLNYLNEWDYNYWIEWHSKYWHLCIPLALIYVCTVFIGTNLMKNKKPFDLRIPLAIWSGLLGAFSLCGSYYFVPEILSSLFNDGFYNTTCDNKYRHDLNYIFWGWLFTWSKVFEFGDTYFIILRKQKLTFLHWFHHAVTVICVFSYFPNHSSINRWTGSMNFFIHSIMYTYYCFKAFRFSIPRFISVIITILQITQMFIGLYVAGYIFHKKYNNISCKMSLNESIFCISIYTSYFVLFLNFFLQTYLKKTKKCINSNSTTNVSSENDLNNIQTKKVKTN